MHHRPTALTGMVSNPEINILPLDHGLPWRYSGEIHRRPICVDLTPKLAKSRIEMHCSTLLADALRSRKQVVASGRVIEGAAFYAYLKARARGAKAIRPRAFHIDL